MKFWVGLIIFVLGVAAGVGGIQFIPASYSSYLPVALQAQNEIVKGIVVRKHQENKRLLLTVSTPRGALLATFTRQIPEINLLVAERDEVTLGLAQYAPFVHDPAIKGVMKPDHFGRPSTEELLPSSGASVPLESEPQAEPVQSAPDVVDP